MAIRHNRETVRHNDPTLRHQDAARLTHKRRTLRHNELDDIQAIAAGSLTITGQVPASLLPQPATGSVSVNAQTPTRVP